MALQFFRRRQKMVIFIMVLLMVSFLVGGYGLSAAFRRDRGALALGTTKFGKLTLADLSVAEGDMALLKILNRNVADHDFAVLVANEDNAALAYAMLQQEASKSPVLVTNDDVNLFLLQRGLEGAQFEALLGALKSRMPGINEDRLRSVIARWMKVEKYFIDATFYTASPASHGAATSEQEMRHLYRDLIERIDLRVAAIKAENFLKDVPEPNDAEIGVQFETYRSELPGRGTEKNPFGFGYAQSDQASVRYLLIRQDVLERVARPTDEELRSYYISHRSSYVKKIALETQPAGATATRPVAFREEPLTFSQARPQIVKDLAELAVRRAMESLVSQAKLLMDQYASGEHGSASNAYEYALARMTVPADAVLAKPLTDVRLRAQTLEQAVAALAEKAGLEAIAFPWGRQGDKTLDPNVKVTIDADRITLGEALDKLCTQLKWPKLKWAEAVGLKGDLFSVGGDGSVDFFPVQMRQTPLMDLNEMIADEVLGHSYTSAEEPLIRIVFTAQPFGRSVRGGGLQVGNDGPSMIVVGPQAGRLLWQLADAKPTHVPQRLDDVPGLKDKVKRDIQIRVAFERAVEKAKRVHEQAAKSGLQAAAKKAGIETFQTGPFARRVGISPQRQYQTMAGMSGQMSFVTLAMQQPFAYPLTEVQGLDLKNTGDVQTFMDAAFALAPAHIEPPYPSKPPMVGTASIPFAREVLVMERLGYDPPVAGEYARVKGILAAQLELTDQWRSRVGWFSVPNIAQRLEYRTRQGGPVEPVAEE
jgi:hypothetical protein